MEENGKDGKQEEHKRNESKSDELKNICTKCDGGRKFLAIINLLPANYNLAVIFLQQTRYVKDTSMQAEVSGAIRRFSSLEPRL
ncbi:hypothetical protein J6590_012593 [Homalodisca vitripennis]|nr:hypothetical protein J6590_012593 [Homalodisca vitripennis]